MEEWSDLAALIRHIVSHHHTYVRAALPALAGSIARLAEMAGAAEPTDLATTFDRLRASLTQHLAKEENILFPFIEELFAAARAKLPFPGSPFGTILHPIRVMEAEHQDTMLLVDRLRALTSGYTVPADAPTAQRECYAELARFEDDLRRHIHLENDVLFPRALELEQELA